jgi:hypothetical protein
MTAMATVVADVVGGGACEVLPPRYSKGASLVHAAVLLQLPVHLPQALHWGLCPKEACPKADAPPDSLRLDLLQASLRGDRHSIIRPRAVMAIFTQ